MAYADLSRDDLEVLHKSTAEEYAAFKAQDLSLNMARGKPSSAQLDLSEPLLTMVVSADECISASGSDCRNYSTLDGLPEAQNLMAALLDDNPANILVGGNSSLTLMYNVITACMDFGPLGSRPWRGHTAVQWICPVPGYDRHFGITEAFHMDMIPVAMNENGPDMDEVERIVACSDRVKGIWCVPKYSNPGGITYSDETVKRLASMECAADDFRIFWDNAYAVHHLSADPSQQDALLDIGSACREAGNPHRYYKFASTSKVTFPGAGISGMATSPENLADIKKRLGVGTICFDKINQLRHVRFLRDADGIAAHMAKHAAILQPKFALVERKLAESLTAVGSCTWSSPHGGYFVSFNAPQGTAKRIVALAKDAGVTMTGAGATWPHGEDPQDSNIRIAPTLPPLEELETALEVFCCCVKLAYLEKLLD